MNTGCGTGHTVCVDPFGVAWGIGCNELGQLGLSEGECIVKIPQKLSSLPIIKQVACGNYHTVCLDDTGSLWSFGYNHHGELGVGDTELRRTPTKLQITGVTSLSCGYAHTACVDEFNVLYVFGKTFVFDDDILSPTKVPKVPPVIKVSCGGAFTIAIGKYGQLISFGYNSHGQTGVGDSIQRKDAQILRFQAEDVACGNLHTLFLHSSGEVSAVGDNGYGQCGLDISGKRPWEYPASSKRQIVRGLPPIRAISAGKKHSLCVDVHGNVWGFGDNSKGQLGIPGEDVIFVPQKLPEVMDIGGISIGSQSDHTFVNTTGTVWGFGDNQWGQLGFSDLYTRRTPTELPIDVAMIWKESRTRMKSARK